MKIKVIYIAGHSYSGSTLLCALLGVHPQIEPVSELALWTKNPSQSMECSCGKLINECGFWKEVQERWLSGVTSREIAQYSAIQKRVESISLNLPMILGITKNYPEAFQVYSKLTVALYTAIAQASNNPIIVDSSKKPARAIALANMDEIDLTIIHLVRNGLRYIESNLNKDESPRNNINLFLRSYYLGLRWALVNSVSGRSIFLNKGKGVRIRYEDFVSQPIETLELLEKSINIDLSYIKEHVQNKRPIPYGHMIGGSHHRKSGAKPIMPEFNSPPSLNKNITFAYRISAGIFENRYGYFKQR
jgi:hypothetical protein